MSSLSDPSWSADFQSAYSRLESDHGETLKLLEDLSMKLRSTSQAHEQAASALQVRQTDNLVPFDLVSVFIPQWSLLDPSPPIPRPCPSVCIMARLLTAGGQPIGTTGTGAPTCTGSNTL